MDNRFFAPTLGVVVSTDDPAQAGRLRVFCPQWDHTQESPTTQQEIEQTKWAEYAGPFLGQIKNMASGPTKEISYGPTGYGFWAIPKVGTQVIIQCINGDPNRRFWTHCVFPSVQANRGLPGGRDKDGTGPWTDSYEALEPYSSNLKEAGLSSGDHYHTRGYERQVAQPLNEKDGSEGYAKNPNTDSGLDPQTYSLTTPGHHFISLQDSPEFCRVRIRTNSGHQLIFDDTNERIYLSTAKGNNYFEMDQDGHIHVYSKESISFSADGDLNFSAKGKVNFKSGDNMNFSSGADLNLTGANINNNAAGSIFDTAGESVNLMSGGDILATGATIHLNGPGAGSASTAASPPITPSHEPWTRPSGSGRGPNWRA